MGSIVVSNLGKAYRQYPTRWSRLAEWVSPWHGQRHSLTWILREINFQVAPGEAVGIIGINGAGKSTLLKLITGTVQPTTGRVRMEGRVAALLELGMGFHPDFTGRQNAFMAGQLLGLQGDEIARVMPEIEDFAEIGEYIDKPVRVYSSGMQMRLAFSVATAIRPDVLIVDEALSVGDAYFQHKSFERIREFRMLGTTLLLVSHDKSAIQSICDRAILLANGTLAMEGAPETVMDCYNAMLAVDDRTCVRQHLAENGQMGMVSGTGQARVEEIGLYNEKGICSDVVFVGENVVLKIKVSVTEPIEKLVLGYMLKDRLGLSVFGTTSENFNISLRDLQKSAVLDFDIGFRINIGPGSYSIATALTSGKTHLEGNFEWRDLASIFTVVNATKSEFVGCVWMEPNMTVSRVADIDV